MDDDLGRRLRRLGVVKGARSLKPPPASSADFPDHQDRESRHSRRPTGKNSGDLGSLLPGAYLAENEMGACLVLDHVYPTDHSHGYLKLGELIGLPTDDAAIFFGDGRIGELSFEDFIFLDTETTGLMGAGTFAFMVGIAFIERDGDQTVFIVRQYFLRDQADEPAMLLFLAQLIEKRPGLITFNGRSFDLPLLDNRYVMNRLDDLAGALVNQPHLDLLHPSRRLWRKRIGSCSLSSLEKRILGLNRTQEDVPGWMIPGLYMDYLRSGDASDLLRVFYHNRIDMLSMVVLAARIINDIRDPQGIAEPLDLISLARWQNALGLAGEAESTLVMASDQEMPLEYFHLTWRELGMLLKKAGRRQDASVHWRQIAVTHIEGQTTAQIALEAHVELAKYFEWHQRDLEEARRWTRQALSMTGDWTPGRSLLVRDDLQHRLTRLDRKIERLDSTK